MDSFFGIGLPELVVILLLAGLVMGPHHIRQVARTLGRLVAQMQTISREFARQLNAELDALDSEEVRGTMEDMKTLRREVDELRRQVRSIPQELGDEGRRAVDEGKRAFKPVSRDAPSEAIDTGADGAPPVVSPDSLPEPLEVRGDPE